MEAQLGYFALNDRTNAAKLTADLIITVLLLEWDTC